MCAVPGRRDLAFLITRCSNDAHRGDTGGWTRIREYVKQGYLRVSYMYTTQNLAEFFTKSLPVKSFQRIRKYLMNY